MEYGQCRTHVGGDTTARHVLSMAGRFWPVDLKDFGAFMNKPEETFGIVVRTVADFLWARSTAGSG